MFGLGFKIGHRYALGAAERDKISQRQSVFCEDRAGFLTLLSQNANSGFEDKLQLG